MNSKRATERPQVADARHQHYDSVTAIIPFFNAASTIGRALDSVASQTHPVTMTVIVDDGSTAAEYQSLVHTVEGYAPMPITILRHEVNSGPAAARNLAWGASNTEWIAFLDADDTWHSRKIELQLNAAGPDTLMVASSSAELDSEHRIAECWVDRQPRAQIISLQDLLLRNRCSTPTVMIRADIPDRFTPGRYYSEDYELWIRVAARGKVIKLLAPLVGLHKARYGDSGLSSHTWRMIAGECITYHRLRRTKTIRARQYILASGFMLLRVPRRLALLSIRAVRRRWTAGATPVAH